MLTMPNDQCLSQQPAVKEESTTTRSSDQSELNLGPILFCMGISGCYSFQQPKPKCTEIALWIYKLTMVSIIILWASRSFVLDDFRSAVAILIILNLMNFECTFNCLICWKSFSIRYGHFKTCIDKLKEVLTEMKNTDIHIDYHRIHNRQWICIITLIVFIVSDLTIQGLTSFVFLPSKEEFDAYGINMTNSYTFPFDDTLFTRAIFLIPVYCLALPLITLPFYLTVINILLLALFNALTSHLENRFVKHVGNLDDIEHFRIIHLKLTAIVTDFDKDFRYLYGNIFFWTLLQAILVLYVLAKSEDHNILALSLVYLMCLTIVILSVMAISAAFLHEAAHAPLDTIYYVNVETISLEKATQLNLFLSKLTGTQVGFTTFGLLTITKEFILTIAGVFLTYFAVLYTTL